MQKYLDISNKFINFTPWIERTCKPFDKGKLTAFPHFKLCQHNFKNVSTMLKYEELPKVNSERWLSLEDLEGEEWRDVVGYEDRFAISNYGRLKRKDRHSYNPQAGVCFFKSKMMRIQTKKGGYKFIVICYSKKRREFLCIHRAVALSFIQNPNNYPIINHKDENPNNNCVYNLEWCTSKYNSNYGTIKKKQRQRYVDAGKIYAIVLYDYEGNVINEYVSARCAANDTGISKRMIVGCCKGIYQTAKGLHFRFKGDKYIKRNVVYNMYSYEIYKDSILIFKTNSIAGLSREININHHTIRNVIKNKVKYCSSLEGYTIIGYVNNNKAFCIKNGIKV